MAAESTTPEESTTTMEHIETPVKRHIIAEWQVPIRGKLYNIEFEHGTTSGKRVLLVDGKEYFRRDWMFKLVGDDEFHLDGVSCIIRVNPASGLRFTYLLLVDGKPYDQYRQRLSKVLKTWEKSFDQRNYRIVLEKDTLNVFLNGEIREEEGMFVDGGTDTHFTEDGIDFRLCARNSGNNREGLVYTLEVNGVEIAESSIE